MSARSAAEWTPLVGERSDLSHVRNKRWLVSAPNLLSTLRSRMADEDGVGDDADGSLAKPGEVGIHVHPSALRKIFPPHVHHQPPSPRPRESQSVFTPTHLPHKTSLLGYFTFSLFLNYCYHFWSYFVPDVSCTCPFQHWQPLTSPDSTSVAFCP